MLNKQLHVALAAQLDDVQETIFFYNGLVCFIQDHSTETWEFDIGRREDNEETTHIDGGFFDGTASDAIVFVVDMTNDIVNRGDVMSKFFKCTIIEQDGTTEGETYMYFELPDHVSHKDKVTMLDNFLLDWYSDGEWENEEKKIAWFPTVGMSVELDVDEIIEADWRILVKHSYNSTQKFLAHLPK